MGWKQWLAVAVVIGGGIVFQIPGHDQPEMDHSSMEHDEIPASMVEVQGQGPYTTVALDVAGMT